jgi:hypothetical protein
LVDRGPEARTVNLTESDIRRIADEAAERAAIAVVRLTVHETLISIGIDPAHPMDAQKDAQFLRSTRIRCEQTGSKAALLFVALLVGGIATTFWKGFLGLFK